MKNLTDFCKTVKPVWICAGKRNVSVFFFLLTKYFGYLKNSFQRASVLQTELKIWKCWVF